MGVGEHGRLDEVPPVALALAADGERGTLVAPGLEEAAHPVELLLGDERAHLGLRVLTGTASVIFLRLPADALTISRPTSVEPVNATLSTPS